MSLNKVALTLDLYDGQGNPLPSGTSLLVPTAVLTDSTDHVIATQVPVKAAHTPAGPPVVSLIANDNDDILPADTGWTITPPAGCGLARFSFILAYSNGASQYLSDLSPAEIGGVVTPPGAEAVAVIASASGATALNVSSAEVFGVTLTGNVTFSFTGASVDGIAFGVYVTQDATGNRVITWPGSVVWPGGDVPTQTLTAAATDSYVFETFNGGTTWYGGQAGANFL